MINLKTKTFVYSRKKISHTTGLTLTELIVASVLVGIVMTGVTSFTFALKGIQNSGNNYHHLAAKTATVLQALIKDAELSVGDTMTQGIAVWKSGVTSTHSICFRHDISDPLSYDDDVWTCYYQASDNIIHRATIQTADLRRNGTFTACTPAEFADPVSYPHCGVSPYAIERYYPCPAAGNEQSSEPCDNYSGFTENITLNLFDREKPTMGFFTANFVTNNGTQTTDAFTCVDGNTNCPVNHLESIEFELITLQDIDKAYHPIENPRYSLKATVSPPGLP